MYEVLRALCTISNMRVYITAILTAIIGFAKCLQYRYHYADSNVLGSPAGHQLFRIPFSQVYLNLRFRRQLHHVSRCQMFRGLLYQLEVTLFEFYQWKNINRFEIRKPNVRGCVLSRCFGVCSSKFLRFKNTP